MENKNGVKFISDKIIELAQIHNYGIMRIEVDERIKNYRIVLSDLEGVKPDTETVARRPAKSILGNSNNILNSSTYTSKSIRQIGIVCADSDEFIEYIRKIKILTKFNPTIKDTIVEQSDKKISYIKISSSLDVINKYFDQIIILPLANTNPEFIKIMDAIKPLS